MIILGIDPGTIKTGIGVIRFEKDKAVLLFSETLHLGAEKPIPERLKVLSERIRFLIKQFSPESFAIETAFYGKNIQSALKIGYARGVSLLAAAEHNLTIAEYSPREVKKAVTGNGNAAKEQVKFMVNTILGIKGEDIGLDASDAIAIALCFAFRNPVQTNAPVRNWKQFVEQHPERIKK